MLNVNKNNIGQRQRYSIRFIKPIFAYLKMWTFTSSEFQQAMVLRLSLVILSIRIFYFPNIGKVRSSNVYHISYFIFYFNDMMNALLL
jgi:hypothetical protein